MRIGMAPALSISVRGATRSASPSMISSRPGQCAAISASAPSARASRSIAITLLGALRQKRAREPARAGADLDHGDARERARGAGDLPGEVEVEEEVLAERLAGVKPMRRDHFAQAAAGRPRRGSSRQSVGELKRRDKARRIGEPFPAMSNAVP